MAFISWDEKYTIGIRELDAQHRQLVVLLGELYDAMQANHAADSLGRTLSQLVAYTRTHFTTEERIMAQYDYPGLEAQKKEHAVFVDKIMKFKTDFDSGRTTISVSLATFVKDWLFTHILGSDKQYGPFLISKGAS